MIVYVYDKECNVKYATYKNVTEIISKDDCYIIYQKENDTTTGIPKEGVKIVVYGF